MKTTESFDVVVIGAGAGGEVVAERCADRGLRVAVVEQQLFAGTIATEPLASMGTTVTSRFTRRDEVTGRPTDGTGASRLAAKGVELVWGRGRLAGTRRVDVDASSATSRRLLATCAVVLATGSTNVMPNIPGLRDAMPWTIHDATVAKEIPPRLAVIGGGAEAVELAQAFARLGSTVTIVEGGPRLVGREEPFAGEELERALGADGISVITGAVVSRVEQAGSDGPSTLFVDEEPIVADRILVAAGRRPTTASLHLDTVGLVSGGPVSVDSMLRVVGPDGALSWLYAIGDCNGLAPLTHMAKYQGRIAADAIAGIATRLGEIVPRITFTDPQIAAVGMTEAGATQHGFKVQVVRTSLSAITGAGTDGAGLTGTAQLVIDATRRVVLGATFTGPGVQELLHAATIAIVAEVPVHRLWHAVPSFPTLSEVWLHMLDDIAA